MYNKCRYTELYQVEIDVIKMSCYNVCTERITGADN